MAIMYDKKKKPSMAYNGIPTTKAFALPEKTTTAPRPTIPVRKPIPTKTASGASTIATASPIVSKQGASTIAKSGQPTLAGRTGANASPEKTAAAKTAMAKTAVAKRAMSSAVPERRNPGGKVMPSQAVAKGISKRRVTRGLLAKRRRRIRMGGSV